MEYRIDNKSGNKLSLLGFGCMRFPRTLGQIDYKKSEKLVLDALDNGINYFDTAYLYFGNEEMLGKIIENNNIRDKMYIATKLPFSRCTKYEDFDRIFNEELKNLRTTYIDYYLIHNIGDIVQWENVCKLGIEKWIQEKKESGQIRQIGFSFHGIKNMFVKLVDAYDWDFCQIQYNYLNIDFQAGRDGLKYASSKGLPVIIMEPLLGGKLANNIPKEVTQLFEKVNDESPATWALKWLFNHEEVTVVLSGMNEDTQLSENVKTASSSHANMLTVEENDIYDKVIDVFNKLYKVNCTGCNYCMPCPHNVNIPGCFGAYNMYYAIGKLDGYIHYINSTKVLSDDVNYAASKCVGCKLCEKKCPQSIKISEELNNVTKKLEPFFIRGVIKIYRLIRNKKVKD